MRQSTFHTAKEAEYLGYLEASLSNSYGYNEEGLFGKATKAAKPSFVNRNRGKLGVLSGLGVGGGSAGAYAGHLKGKLGKAGEEIAGYQGKLGKANEEIAGYQGKLDKANENINALNIKINDLQTMVDNKTFENLAKSDQIALLRSVFGKASDLDISEAVRIYNKMVKEGGISVRGGILRWINTFSSKLADGANQRNVRIILNSMFGLD